MITADTAGILIWITSLLIASGLTWAVMYVCRKGKSSPRAAKSTAILVISSDPSGLIHADPDVTEFLGLSMDQLRQNAFAWLDSLPEERASVMRECVYTRPLHIAYSGPHNEPVHIYTRPMGKTSDGADQVLVTVGSEQKESDRNEGFTAFLDNSPTAVCLGCTDGIVYVNDMFLKLTGYSREDVSGWKSSDFLQMVHPGDRARVRSVIRDFIEGAVDTVRLELRALDRTGEIRWLVAHVSAYSTGEKRCFGAIVLDIDRHKHTEHELKLAEKRLLFYIENANDLVYFYGVDGSTSFFNDAVADLTGYSREELAQDPTLWDQVIAGGERKAIADSAESLAGLPSHEVEYQINCRDGKTRWFQSRMVPVDDAEGRLAGFSCIDRDITRLKVAEETVQRQSEMYRSTIEAISHPFCLIDISDRRVIAANSASGAGDRLGQVTCYELLHGRNTPCSDLDTECPLRMLQRTRQPVTVEHVHKIADSSSCVQEVHTYPVYDENGVVQQAILYAHDVTNEVRFEKARSVLLRISRAASTCSGLQDLLHAIKEHLGAVVNTNNFFVALYDTESDSYSVPYIADEYFSGDEVPDELLRKGLTDYVRRTGEPVLVDEHKFADLVEDGDVILAGEPSPIWMGVPLKTLRGTIGVVGLQNYNDPYAFTDQDLELMTLISGTIALVIERQQGQDELAESRQNYENLYNSALVGLVRWRVSDWTMLECNESAVRLFGCKSRGELLEYAVEHPICTHSKSLGQMLEQIPVTSRIDECEAKFMRKTGQTFWARFSAQVNSEADYVDIALADISEAKEAVEAQRRLATAVQQSGEMIVIADSVGRIEYVNPSFEQITGFSSVEVVGLHLGDPRNGLVGSQLFDEIWETVGDGEHWSGQYTGLKKDESRYDGQATVSPVRTESGKIANYTMVIRDVTVQSSLERQLRQAIKMEAIGRLAGGIAHDFNNMLTSMVMNTELLQMDIDEDDERRTYLDEIAHTSELATRLTRQLLTFSKRGASKPEVLDIRVVMENVARLLRSIIGEDINLKLDCGSGELRVRIDASYIEQVIVNLSVNARDAMPDGGSLVISAKLVELDELYAREHAGTSPGWYVMLSVSDTGTGMDSETQAKVFEPFFTTKGEAGTGIGLATVYGIVQQAGGHINLYSEPGQGTTFKVYLPWVDSPLKSESVQPDTCESVISVARETILVVEDEDSIRHLLVDLLSRNNYDVKSASTAEDACEMASETADVIDMLLTDVVLPGMNGKELADKLLDERPDLKVIFTSGYNENIISQHGVLDPGITFVQKPYNVRDLLRIIRRELDNLTVHGLQN